MDLQAYLAMLQNQPTAPSASEVATWGNQRRELGTTFGTAAAQNAFATGALDASRAVDVGSLTQQYARMRENLPTAYAKRGLGDSGIYGRGLMEYGQNKAEAFGKLLTQYNTQYGQLAQNARAAYSSYGSGMQDVAASEQARRAELASALRNL